MRRTYDFRDFPATRLVSAKKGRRVSVCLPARDEAATVGQIVTAIRAELMDRNSVVDELLVVDDGSTDATARVAEDAGASVIDAASVLAEYGDGPGKGGAMWKAVHVATGDLIVFCDADVRDFDTGFVRGLVGPLLTRDDVTFVKGFYERPVDGVARQGGRVTELMARPLIWTFFRHLSDLAQPLSGECAAPREVLESLPFVDGYGVDLGLIIDVVQRFGNAGLVQSDLGQRVHRNRPLSDLSPQALAVLHLGLERAGALGPGAGISVPELPPLCEVPAHRKTA
jgi:glucosyl-3-phosphoglycerate synthase